TNPLQKSNAGGLQDVFVAKFAKAGSPVYSTYVGGIGNDQPFGIAVDSGGNAYVAGYTSSFNFPNISAAQTAFGAGSDDAFFFKINAAGTALDSSTLIGGTGSDEAVRIAVDKSGSAYVTGYTNSLNFPVVKPYQSLPKGGFDAFVTRLAPDGKSFVFSTYFGGNQDDSGVGIALDGAGD